MYGLELGIIIISTLSCALANPSSSMDSTSVLVFWRVMMVRAGNRGPSCFDRGN